MFERQHAKRKTQTLMMFVESMPGTGTVEPVGELPVCMDHGGGVLQAVTLWWWWWWLDPIISFFYFSVIFGTSPLSPIPGIACF